MAPQFYRGVVKYISPPVTQPRVGGVTTKGIGLRLPEAPTFDMTAIKNEVFQSYKRADLADTAL